MTYLPHIATLILGTPLMIQKEKLDAILSVIGSRVGIATPEAAQFNPSTTQTNQPERVGTIAVLPIQGSLVKREMPINAVSGLTSYQAIGKAFNAAMADSSVGGILLDIGSSGGEVGGLFDLADTIKTARGKKPIWALADNAFSAAYLLASAADKIYLSQTAGVGSIGVLAVHVDESEKDAKEGRKFTAIHAGKHKLDGNPHDPLADSARGRMQKEVNRLYGMFASAVALNRGMTEEAIRATEAGVFFGSDAVKVGLADAIGTKEYAIADFQILLGEKAVKDEEIEQYRAEGAAAALEKYRADAAEIVSVCSAMEHSGFESLAGEFIAKGTSVDAVRADLLKRLADSDGGETHSQTLPGYGTGHDGVGGGNLLAQAVQRMTGVK